MTTTEIPYKLDTPGFPANTPQKANKPTTTPSIDARISISLAAIRTASGNGTFDRSKLDTATLLWMLAPAEQSATATIQDARTSATAYGFTNSGEALRYMLAAHHLHRANITI
ncbi:hypothetical protein ACIBCR_15260 [Micromonospora echinospora]|uniref:hypothetical protein n=1 Tax=Micromonospora echinospora TaxID=1877 RepID=UPI00379D5D2C